MTTATNVYDRHQYYFFASIRSLCLFFVFFFHCTKIFDADDWHIKNDVTSNIGSGLVVQIGLCVMPMFFFISGGSVWLSMQKRSAGTFIKNLFKRFFVPLLLGVTVLGLPQVYYERVSHGQYHGSLISFIPHYFDGFYMFGGNFAWTGIHLWYMLVLFLFSLILVPYFILGRKFFYRPFFQKIFSSPYVFLLLIPILFYPGWKLSPTGFWGYKIWGGWNLFEHLFFFAAGFAVFSGRNTVESNKKVTWIALGIAIVLSAIIVYWYFHPLTTKFRSADFNLHLLVRLGACFAWFSAMIGFTSMYMNKPKKVLDYINRSALPFYILNQPITIILGFYIIQWHLPASVKFAFVTLGSLATTFLLYELIKLNHITKWLFGIPDKESVKRMNAMLKRRRKQQETLNQEPGLFMKPADQPLAGPENPPQS